MATFIVSGYTRDAPGAKSRPFQVVIMADSAYEAKKIVKRRDPKAEIRNAYRAMR